MTKKNMPKEYASDTKRLGTLYMVFYSIKQDNKLPGSIPQRTLYRYTKILKERGIVKKLSYGTWIIANPKKAMEFEEKYHKKEYAKKSLLSPSLSPKDFLVTDKRGHRLLLIITTPQLKLQALKKHFDYIKRGNPKWMNGGRAGKYLRLYFGNAKFNLYKDHTVVEFTKEFYATHHILTQEQAQTHFLAVLDTFENNMPVSIRIGKELHIKDSMHFEKVNSDYAKYCYEKGLKINFTQGDFKYWQDKSKGTCNEEGNNPRIMDILDGIAQVDMMKTVSEYAQITGGRNILLDLSKKVNDLSDIIKPQQQSLNTSKDNNDDEGKGSSSAPSSYIG